jgi:hypothetical protein
VVVGEPPPCFVAGRKNYVVDSRDIKAISVSQRAASRNWMQELPGNAGRLSNCTIIGHIKRPGFVSIRKDVFVDVKEVGAFLIAAVSIRNAMESRSG